MLCPPSIKESLEAEEADENFEKVRVIEDTCIYEKSLIPEKSLEI